MICRRWTTAAALLVPGTVLFLLGATGAPAQVRDTVPGGVEASSCPREVAGAAAGGVEGLVLDPATGLPLPGATVTAHRSATDLLPEADASPVTAVTDSAGRYRICHLAAGASVTLQAERFGNESASVRVWIGADSVTHRDLPIEFGPPGRLVGRVTDRASSEAVESATLTLVGLSVSALTDEDGRFEMPPAPPGTHELQLEHVAYGTVSDTVTLVPGQTVSLNAQAEQRPIRVAPLAVTVDDTRPRWLENTGFYHRRDLKHGTFFTPDQLVEEDPNRLSDLFRGIPGIQIRNGQLTMARSPRSLVTGRRCPLQYFVNGGLAMLPVGINTFRPQDVAAIEVYKGPSEVPMEFSKGRSSCGAVVVWLKVER